MLVTCAALQKPRDREAGFHGDVSQLYWYSLQKGEKLPSAQCVHTHMHTYACTHMHTHTHAHVHAYSHTCTHGHIHILAHTYTHACTLTRVHARTYIHKGTHTRTHILRLDKLVISTIYSEKCKIIERG